MCPARGPAHVEEVASGEWNIGGRPLSKADVKALAACGERRLGRGMARLPGVQDAVCQVTVAAELPRAKADVSRLATLAARSHQPEFAARASHHSAALVTPAR